MYWFLFTNLVHTLFLASWNAKTNHLTKATHIYNISHSVLICIFQNKLNWYGFHEHPKINWVCIHERRKCAFRRAHMRSYDDEVMGDVMGGGGNQGNNKNNWVTREPLLQLTEEPMLWCVCLWCTAGKLPSKTAINVQTTNSKAINVQTTYRKAKHRKYMLCADAFTFLITETIHLKSSRKLNALNFVYAHTELLAYFHQREAFDIYTNYTLLHQIHNSTWAWEFSRLCWNCNSFRYNLIILVYFKFNISVCFVINFPNYSIYNWYNHALLLYYVTFSLYYVTFSLSGHMQY